MQRLQNKTAVITGGTSGIGKATAIDFINNGATVIITGRFQKTVDETVAELGENCFGIVSDAGNMLNVMTLGEQIKKISSSIDILFVNGSYVKYAPVELIDEQHYNELFNVIVRGTLFTVQQLLPLMQPGSSVILNTSIATELGMPNAAIYSAAKAAVQSFVKTFAADLSKKGIRVNGISPGPIKTNWTDKAGFTVGQVKDFENAIIPQVALGRLGDASDIAKAVTFLASGDAAFMQGTEMFVNGGFPAIRV